MKNISIFISKYFPLTISFVLLFIVIISLNHKNSLLEYDLLKVKNQFYSRDNKLYNNVKHLNDFVYLLNKDVRNIMTNGTQKFYLIVLLGKTRFCTTCLKSELLEIDKLVKRYPSNTIVVLLDLKKDLKIFEHFGNNINIVKPANFEYSHKLELGYPSILLVDGNFLIYSIYQAEEFNESKRNVFYKKLYVTFPKLIKNYE